MSGLRALFDGAVGLGPEDRRRYLERACADGPTRARVERMLSLLDAHPGFLGTPVVDGGTAGEALHGAEPGVPERVGRYRVVRTLGTGGMGTVYEAEQSAPRRRVALKVLRTTLSGPRAAARFEVEAEALGRLRHPGIAQIHEAGTAETPGGTRPYFVMELVEGVPIDRHVRESGAGVRRRLELIASVADAIHHAHQHGVVHRDVKAANVLVDADGRARVVDFGIAHLADRAADGAADGGAEADGSGTIGAMSPERLAGETDQADTGADVYALGVLAYELLAGRPPYDLRGKSAMEAAQILATTEPTPLGAMDRRLRGDVEAIVAKAMAADADARYRSASELGEDVRRHLRGEPVSARAATVAYQVATLVRRHRAAFAGLAAASVALVLGGVGTGIGLVWALEERSSTASALAESERLVSALERVLTSPDPRLLGHDASVSDLLAQAEASLEEELAGSARLASRVRHTIGATYLALGRLEEAERLLTGALAARRDELGPSDPRTLETMAALGRTLLVLGRFGEAEGLLRGALAGRREALGPDHPDTLSSLHAVGLLLDKSGRYDEAATALEALRRRAGRTLGAEDPLTLTAENCIANLRAHRGDLRGSLSIHERTLEARRRVLGAEHPDTLQSMGNVAAVLTDVGEHARAAAHLEAALEASEVVLGARHPETLNTAANLAAVLRRLGREDEALALMTRTLEARRETLGPTHPQTVISMGNLAAFHARRGEAERAERLFGRAVEGAAASLGEDHPTLALLRVAHAGTLIDLARFAESEAALEAAWRVLSSGSGAQHRARCADAHVRLYEAWGRSEEAAAWRERSGE